MSINEITGLGEGGPVLDTTLAGVPSLVILGDADLAWVQGHPRGSSLPRLKSWSQRFLTLSIGIPAAMSVLIVLACFVAPYVFGLPSPNATDLSHSFERIGSSGHLLGTNSLGNDMFSRLLHGGQVSIVVGVSATAIGLGIGSALGMIAGYVGGAVSALIMRLLDIILSIPGLVLAIAIAAYLGPSERNTIIAISFFGISTYGRLSRSQTLAYRHRDFIVASETMCASRRHIIFRHILPNIIPYLMAYALTTMGQAMLVEATLSYIGVGIRLPQASWGNLIGAGQPYLSSDPQLVILPSAFMFATVVSLNLLADALHKRFS